MTKSPQLSAILWSMVATLGGLGCFVLPAFFTPGTDHNAAYGHPLIPWFALAYANIRFLPTVYSYFGLGLAVGAAQPRRWWLMAGLAVCLPPVLNAINISGDWKIDPTSHNLFPFEFIILAVVSGPVWLGAFLGSKISKRFWPQTRPLESMDAKN